MGGGGGAKFGSWWWVWRGYGIGFWDGAVFSGRGGFGSVFGVGTHAKLGLGGWWSGGLCDWAETTSAYLCSNETRRG